VALKISLLMMLQQMMLLMTKLRLTMTLQARTEPM
jgi:hypothetical protein